LVKAILAVIHCTTILMRLSGSAQLAW